MAAKGLRGSIPDQRVVVVGAGVVGAATGRGLLASGHQVFFSDVSKERLAALEAEGLQTLEPERIRDARADTFLISVPTPTTGSRADLSFLEDATRTVGRAIASHPGRPLIVVRSTVPPGTTENVVIPLLRFSSTRRAGRGFGVCVNPEFLRAASAEADFMSPRVIVIGAMDEPSERALRDLYAKWPEVPVLAMSLRSAECAKYVANLFNATKISFFNELHMILSSIGADPDRAFEAAALGAEGLWNPRYGTRGGSPFGGACLPKDAIAFRGFAEDQGLGSLLRMLQATIDVNEDLSATSRLAAAGGAGQESPGSGAAD